MPNDNSALYNSKVEKNDEFYTLMEDIEHEFSQYDFTQFKDKIIYCNCDDPTWSNFFKFFVKWGKRLGIKEACFTNFANGKRQFKQLSLFESDDLVDSAEDDKHGTAHYWIYNPTTEKIVKKELKGNGDFRSAECIKFLEQADVVVTNPPFSLYREYIEQLAHYNKKFLIIGGQNAIGSKNIFKLIMENKMWLGNSVGLIGIINSDGKKITAREPEGSIPRACCWYTNLDVKKRKQPLVLHPQDLSTYIRYDNYDAIDISQVKLIPENYDGIMTELWAFH